MKVPVFIHNVASAYPGNGGLSVDDRDNPFSTILGKANDGLHFQGLWDTHGQGIDSIEAIADHDRNIYGPQGIDYVPWGVIHGRWEGWMDQEYARDEGRLAAQIAVAAAGPVETPTYIVDLEPYYHAPFPAYWRSDIGAGEAEADAFVKAFRNGTNDRGRLWLAIDARDPHLEPVSFRRWIGHSEVRRILPMVYFTDFVRPRVATTADAMDALRTMESVLAQHGASMFVKRGIHPIFPGDASPSVMEYAIEDAYQMGFGGVSVWQRGNLSLETAETIAAMDDPWAQTEPVPPPADIGAIRGYLDIIEGRTAAIDADLGTIRGSIENIRTELEGW